MPIMRDLIARNRPPSLDEFHRVSVIFWILSKIRVVSQPGAP
jgi:hypothetical protein